MRTHASMRLVQYSAVQKMMKSSTHSAPCGNCTKRHTPGREHCPAKDSTCHSCQKIGHWKQKCRKSNKNWNAHRITKMQYQAQSLQWNKHSSTRCTGHTHHLEGWGNKGSKQNGYYFLYCWYTRSAILGLPSCSRLRIVNLNCSVQLRKHGQPVKVSKEREKVKQDMKNLKLINSKDDLIKAYPDRFEGIGKFPGTYHIYLKEDAIPVVHTPRKCPISIRPLVDKKLDKLLEQDVIVPVTEPTDWVSSLAYSWKADGDLRTCLNPTHLNKAIRRDHYRTPTLEEITHELAGSTKFTKVDGYSSYYCIVLDYESSLLTTFNTHRGRFRFVRLPFGLACAQDIFQRMMDQILDRCEGVIGIADDIIIHGKDDAEHDRRLHKFMRVAREHGLVLNKKKCEVKSNSVKFFGCVYDKHGAHPDPSKVSAIKEMPAPQNKGELQSFLGMVTYLSPFIPQLSSHTATLRGLLKTDVEYSWNATYQVAFDKLKSLVCEDTTLKYFNTKKPVTIQVDASGKGLGAALIQDDGPVAFASKALTPTEQRYANNERELLAASSVQNVSGHMFLVDTSWSRVTTNH